MPIQRQMAAMIANIAATITKAKPKLRLLVTTAEEQKQLFYLSIKPISFTRIGGVMVSFLVSIAINCGFEPRSGLPKGYTIGM
jgi:hypothetical protein